MPISCRIFLTKLYSLPSPFLTLLQKLVAVDFGCVYGSGDWSQGDVAGDGVLCVYNCVNVFKPGA